MNQSPQLQRAMLLQEQGRHELAEKELRHHLVAEPADGFAHALLALSLAHLERRDEAEQAARDAISNAPDLGFAHYALARVLSDRNRDVEAVDSINEAIRLEPTDADYRGLLAGIEFARERWKETLAAAEQGLEFDPEHITCNNLRAMALVKLGRKADAGVTIDATLARNPDDAFSHANKGWTLLEQGKRKEAMTHFRESLRLDPTNDWARAGLVEAIKAGNPVYAVMLKYFLWMAKLSGNARWAIVMGGYIGSKMLASFGRKNPEMAPWILPLQIAYLVFVVLSWLAAPVFNLMLFLHPYGRHALDREQRVQASWVGLLLGMALGSLGLWFVSGRDDAYLVPAIVFGLLAIPVSAVYSCALGWPRKVMAYAASVLALLGLTSVYFEVFARASSDIGGASFNMFLLGSLLSQFLANFLGGKTPER